MKKIINKPETLILEMCNGIVMTHQELKLNEKYKIISKEVINKDKVSLISGGGSGHEPAHAGFVGLGMLDAAVCGDVFASPSQVQVYQAIKEVATDKGVLLIIKNYSGDIMNFKNAAHLACEDGIKVDFIKVDDDIAVEDSLYTVGRRGVAGTIFVHKIVGASSERGYSLDEVKRIGEKAVANTKSIGFAFSSCTVPAKGSPTFEISENEMEYGVGIHGEPGIKRENILSADELADRMVYSLLKELDIKDNNQEIAVLINGFGATPMQELYLLNNSVMKMLNTKNIVPFTSFVGNYMTSIDMIGASISIIKLDDELKSLLSDKCSTPGMKFDSITPMKKYNEINSVQDNDENVDFSLTTDKSFKELKNEEITLQNMIYIIDKMSDVIIKNEVPFCDLDSHAGDGDFGMSVAKGFKQLKREWADLTSSDSISSFLDKCSMIIMQHCGGASGPIWGSAFRSASRSTSNKNSLTKEDFATMMQDIVKGIQATGERSFGRGAVVGDKTLIDALIPCSNAWSENHSNLSMKELFEKGAKNAVDGADATKEIVAHMGRAGTVGERSIGYPDAGAFALGVIFTEIANDL